MPLVRKDPPAAPPAAAAESRLTSGSADDRWAAARDLARPGGAEPLAKALASESDPRVRDAIFTSLTQIGGEAAVAAILPCLRSDDAGLRTGALDALAILPEAAATRLGELLGDRDADVRILACEVARHAPVETACACLVRVLEQDPEVNVCAGAVEVLAEIGDASVLPALQTCAHRFPAESFLRFAIKVAMDRIGSPARG